MQKTRASLLVIAATALTVATLFLLPFTPKAAVRTAVVERGAFIRSTLLEGVIGYAQEQPLLALQPGRIARVHVQQGQRVSAGELLVSMDTEAQEQELAAVTRMLYEQQEAAAAFGQAGEAAFAAAESTLEGQKRQAELRAAIASGQIRAAADGVVGAIYTSEGEYAGEMSLLGTVHGEELSVIAAGRPSSRVPAERIWGPPCSARQERPKRTRRRGRRCSRFLFCPRAQAPGRRRGWATAWWWSWCARRWRTGRWCR